MPQVSLVAFLTMKIEIGKIVKAQGIKGEVKLACYLDDASMLKGVEQIFIGTKAYTVKQLRCDGAFCYMLLDGVNDRNSAEALRNWTVCAEKESVRLPQNRYFIDDLKKCKVSTSDGKLIGEVVDVLQYGAADVFVCNGECGTVSFPFLNELIIKIDIESKVIIVNEKRFNEVAVYED